MMKLGAVVFVYVVVLWLAASAVHAAPKRRVMPWMCLERCGGNATSIAANLREIDAHKHFLSAVSFDLYNLGANSQLVRNKLTPVHKQISAMGLETFPMVSSYPYPPQFLSWMRQVFAKPQPFIDTAISEAKKEGFTGYNIDWEPTTEGTNQDAIDYAHFLTTLSNALHAHHIKVTVDIASWSNIWNFTELSKSTVDKVMDMSTYTGTFATFLAQLNKAVNSFRLDMLGIGLETVDTVTKKPFTNAQLAIRFAVIRKNNIQEVDVWDMPIPSNMWVYLDDFATR